MQERKANYIETLLVLDVLFWAIFASHLQIDLSPPRAWLITICAGLLDIDCAI